MNKINTYGELIQERERLQFQLEVHRQAVRMHVSDIQQKLNPLKNALQFFSNFTAPPATNPLVDAGVGLTLELLIRRIFFAKTGWIARLVGPILVKNFSANMINKNKDTLIKKMKSLFHLNGRES